MEQFRGFPKFPYLGPTNEPMMGFPHRVENLDALPNQILILDVTDPRCVVLDGSGNAQKLIDKSGGNDAVIAQASRPPYFASGGANNKPYISKATAKTISYSLNTRFSPLTVYAVVQMGSIPVTGTNFIALGNTGGTNGIERIIAAGGNGWRMYSSIAPTYSTTSSLPTRTDWMLIKLVWKSESSFWVEVNDEPVGMILPNSSNKNLSIFNIFTLNINNSLFHELRIFNETISNWTKDNAEKDQIIKDTLIAKYGLSRPSGKKNVMIFGDSQSVPVMSGTNVNLGSYNVRMQATGDYNMLTEATSGTTLNSFPNLSQGGVNNFVAKYNNYNKSKWSDFYVVINYGTNDSSIRSFGTGPTRSEWIAYYKEYIRSFLSAGFTASKIILVTPPYSTGVYVGATLAEFQADIQGICTDMGTTLCDWYQAMVTGGLDINTVVGGDLIHGDNAVHTALYDTLTPLIV